MKNNWIIRKQDNKHVSIYGTRVRRDCDEIISHYRISTSTGSFLEYSFSLPDHILRIEHASFKNREDQEIIINTLDEDIQLMRPEEVKCDKNFPLKYLTELHHSEGSERII